MNKELNIIHIQLLQEEAKLDLRDRALAWEALGKPEGTFKTSAVERLCDEIERLRRHLLRADASGKVDKAPNGGGA